MFYLRFLTVFILLSCPLSSVEYLKKNPHEEILRRLEYKENRGFFTPPKGWKMVHPKQLHENVDFMLIGKGKNEFPPSINIASEEFSGSLEDYLQIVKEINQEKGLHWKSLGKIETLSGKGSFSQVDSSTEWGEIRMMHLIVKHNQNIYVMTSTALKKEFSKFYPTFFQAMRSFRINPSLLSYIQDDNEKKHIKESLDLIEQEADSQKKKSLIETLNEKLNQTEILSSVKEQLIEDLKTTHLPEKGA